MRRRSFLGGLAALAATPAAFITRTPFPTPLPSGRDKVAGVAGGTGAGSAVGVKRPDLAPMLELTRFDDAPPALSLQRPLFYHQPRYFDRTRSTPSPIDLADADYRAVRVELRVANGYDFQQNGAFDAADRFLRGVMTFVGDQATTRVETSDDQIAWHALDEPRALGTMRFALLETSADETNDDDEADDDLD